MFLLSSQWNRFKVSLDLIDEIRAYIQEFSAKKLVARCYNTKVIPRETKEGNLVLRQLVAPKRIGKLLPDWEGSYIIKGMLTHIAYKLEEMNGDPVPRTWNTVKLRHYYN